MLPLAGLLAWALWRPAGMRAAGLAPSPAGRPLWMAGWCLLALVSPLCRLARTLVSGHMLQLWVLTMAAPLLMAAGNLAGDRPRHGARRARWLAPATLAYAAALWLRHLPDVYGAALTSPAVHVAVVALLVGSSLWFWNGVLRTRHAGAGDTGRAVPALLATTAHTGLLGALPTFASTSFYPLQTGSATAWGLSHLEDQQLAGMLMWVRGSLAYLAAGTVLALARMREDDAAARPVLA